MSLESRIGRIEKAVGGDGSGCPACRYAQVPKVYGVVFAHEQPAFEPEDTVCEVCGRVIAQGREFMVDLESGPTEVGHG